MSLGERFECISTSAQPTEDKTEADKRQTPSACLPVLSLPSKPAAWLTRTAISYVRPSRCCLHDSVCLLPICITVCWCASRATRLLNRTFIRDSHAQEIVPLFCGAVSAMHFAWSATWRIRTCARWHCSRCKGIAGQHADKSKVGKAGPKHGAQNWRIEAFYCLTRRNMLFRGTSQRDPAFWANVLGQLQIHPHTISFLSDNLSTARFNLSCQLAEAQSPVQRQPRSALLQVYKDKEVVMRYLRRRGGAINSSHLDSKIY